MKKAIAIVLNVFVLLYLLSGCSVSNVQEKDKRIAELESQLSEMQILLNETQAQLNEAISDTDNSPINIKQDVSLNVQKISIGETISLNFAEITIESFEWLDEILPPDTSSAYTYMSDKENEIFLVLHGRIKNISGDSYKIDNLASEFLVNDKYRYNGETFGVSDDNRGYYGDTVIPLKDRTFVIYSSVPDEIKNSFADCIVTFGFNDSFNNSNNAKIEELMHKFSIMLK